MNTASAAHRPPSSPHAGRWFALAGVVLLWSYWPAIRELITFWSVNEDYSAGALAPLVVAWVLWSERAELGRLALRPSLWGAGLLAGAQAVRLWAIYDDYASLERYSLVLSFIGLTLWLGGWALARRLAWVFLFLLLMVPFPWSIHNALNVPLQGFATGSSVFALELLGFWVQRSGNILELDGRTHVAVAEACNGLRMLTAFVFVAGAMALFAPRPAWQRAILLISSVPVAILSNSIRLVVTVILFHYVDSTAADKFFHDFAGIVMMPFAVLVLFGELALLKWIADDPSKRASSPRARAAVRAGESPA